MTYEKIKLHHEKIVRQVKFANLNKNGSLEDYKAEVEKGDYDYQDCVVKQVIYVNQNQWKDLTNSFLADNIIWNEIGGHDLRKKDIAEFKRLGTKEVNDYPNWNKEQTDFFRKNCVCEVTELINNDTGETIYINTEGYEYARYVGIMEVA